MATATHQSVPSGREIGNAALEVAKDVASAAGQKAGEAAAYVGEKADDAVMAVGSGMKHVADSIRENTPSEGLRGEASALWANCLENSGKYLEKQGISGIGDDVSKVIRRHPIPAVLIGIGLGFLIARVSKR